MYAVGNLPDHVTRYNRKNPNRWMVQSGPVHHVTAWDVLSRVAVVLSVSGMVCAAVFVLRGLGV